MKQAFVLMVIIAHVVSACADTMTLLTLQDGSILKTQLQTERIICETSFSNELTLSPELLRAVEMIGTNGTAKIDLTNGDKLTATLKTHSFAFRSILGDISVSRVKIKALTFHNATPQNTKRNKLVFHCTFDDAESIISPAIGPNGVFQGGSFIPGKSGNALNVPAHTSCAKFNMPAGAFGPSGTIEFWAKITDLTPLTDGGCPRFFQILDIDARGEISQDWNANNGSGGSGLTFRINGLPVMSSSTRAMSSQGTCAQRPPMVPSAGWHHYALVWDTQGVGSPNGPSAVVYIDGRPVLRTPFIPEWKGPFPLGRGSTLFFPNREDEMPSYARRAYMIDDFKIWDFAKTDLAHP